MRIPPRPVLAVLLVLSTLGVPRAAAQGGAERVALDSSGLPALDFSNAPSVSDDGRYVAFVSFDPNLAPGEANGKEDVFVRDLVLGVTERVAPGATEACRFPSISGDGRYVAFVTKSQNLVSTSLSGEEQVLLFDRQTGTVELISRATTGAGGDQGAGLPAVSRDGRYVSFQSYSNDIVPGDSNFTADIYLRDRLLGVTELISVGNAGQQTAEHCYGSALTPDARYVIFETRADNIEPAPNGYRDVFRRDRLLGITEKVSFSSTGGATDGRSEGPLDISDDGRFISFQSEADNLVPGQAQDPYPVRAVFLRDMQLGVTELVSVDPLSPTAAELGDAFDAALSGDGRLVSFASGVTGAVYLRDRVTKTTLRVDHGDLGQAGNRESTETELADDVPTLVFTSASTNLVVGDTNGVPEVLLRRFPRAGELDLSGTTAGTAVTVTATGLVPGTVLLLGVSLSGPGPLPSGYGLVDLGGVPSLFVLSADAAGAASFTATLPLASVGAPLWVQGLDLFSGTLTPGIGRFIE